MTALDRPTLFLLGLLSALRALSLVVLAGAVASGIVGVIGGSPSDLPGRLGDWRSAVIWGLAAAALRAVVTWARRVVAARALLGAKERLRAELAEKLVAQGGPTVGASSTLATRGLDELDKYVTVFLPALVDAAVVPLLVGVWILSADWLSAVIIVVTVPLIPVFMALIGMHTRDRVTVATDALARLSEHLVELARGLPVLVGLGRAQEQVLALRALSEQYRVKTVQTLKTAFLSALALELIATLSVALVAVTIGVRLVAGDMPLEIGLLVLLLAPECYTPLREIGTAFHASQDGKEALQRVRAVLDEPVGEALGVSSPLGASSPLGPVGSGAVGPLRVTGLRVTYAGRDVPAVADLSFTAPTGQITVLDGASGAGKSTVLAVLAGSLEGDATGLVTGLDRDRIAWLPQHPHTVATTVLAELLVYGDGLPDAEQLALGALAQLGLAHLADVDPARLSPGELRRLAFARVLLRMEAGTQLVLLDEPTAHLDEASADVLIPVIAGLRGRATVIVASHDPAVRLLADHVVRVSAGAADSRTVLGATVARSVPGGVDDVVGSGARDVVGSGDIQQAAPRQVPLREPATPASPAMSSEPALPVGLGSALRELRAFLRPVAGRIGVSTALGTLSTLFAVALTALSGWLIVRASEQPPIMYLLVAIVGVRFFGIGRAVLRYTERLASHDAIFAALTSLRMRLWTGLARRGARNRALLTGANALDRLVRDVDQVRDLSIRVVMPPVVGVLTMVAAVVVLGVVYPPSIPLFVALGALGLVAAPGVALWADRTAGRGQQVLRSRVCAGLSPCWARRTSCG